MNCNLAKRIIATILVISCAVSLMISCLNNKRTVVFSEEGDSCTYQDNTYVLFEFEDSSACWRPILEADEIKQVDRMPFALLRTFSKKPIYVTKEECPYFVIISYTGDKIEPNFSFPYIREDIELLSVYETSFGNISVEYNRGLDEIDQEFKNIPSGTKFVDLIDETTKSKVRPDNAKYYCTLYCSYPNIDYLKCDFEILIAEDVYYLEDGGIYYRYHGV